MAENERINVWIKIRDQARFRRMAGQIADDVKKIGDSAKDANSPLNQMGEAISKLTNSMAPGRTRLFGFAIGTVVTALTAAVPVAVGLGGALVALAGSAASAGVGLGLFGSTAAALAATGLGGLALVVANAATGFNKVKDAQDRFRLAVASFGRDSTQAETALARLHGTVQLFGGRDMLTAVNAFEALSGEWRELTKPAMRSVALLFYDIISAMRELAPTVAGVTNRVADLMQRGLGVMVRVLSGREMRTIIRNLGDVFGQMSGPLIRAATGFLLGIFRIANRLAPMLIPMAEAVERVANSFAQWAKSGDLSPFTDQLKSWWNLLVAVGDLLVTVLGGGDEQGQSMVDTLTAIVRKWDEFLESAQGQTALKDFFTDAVNMTKAFIGVVADVIEGIFSFGRALLPAYTTIFGAIQSGIQQFLDALHPMKPFWDNVLAPLLEGIISGVGAGVVGAFKLLIGIVKVVSSVLGFLGSVVGPKLQPVFKALGQVIGFIFGGAILKLLGSIGKLNVLLRPLGMLFRLIGVPIRWAGAALGWFFGRLVALGGVIGRVVGNFLPTLRNHFNAIIGFIRSIGGRFFDAGRRLWTRLKDGIMGAIGSGLGFAGDIAKAVANAIIGLLNSAIPNSLPVPFAPDIDIPNNPIPMLAAGGVVSGNGSWLTGEAGPELNTMINGKVVVQPLAQGIQPVSSGASIGPGGGKRTLVTNVFLRGRNIAQAVAEEADDDAHG